MSDQLLLKLTTAVARRAVVCTTPAALKSFALKFLEVVHTLDYTARKARARARVRGRVRARVRAGVRVRVRARARLRVKVRVRVMVRLKVMVRDRVRVRVNPNPIPKQEPDKKASFIGALKLPWAKETSTEHARLSAHHEQARRG